MLYKSNGEPYTFQCSTCAKVYEPGGWIKCSCGGLVMVITVDEPCDTTESIERAESAICHHVGRMLLYPEFRMQRRKLYTANMVS